MYVTREHLLVMIDNLRTMQAEYPYGSKDYMEIETMIGTVAGIVAWIEDQTDAETEQKCPHCNEWHSDIDPRSN